MKGIKSIVQSLGTRRVKYGGYAVLIIFAVITALIIANLIFGQISPRIDLTGNKLFSLSEQTLQVIDSLKSPVSLYGLWRPGQESGSIQEVVNLYTARSKNISFEALDPDKNPGLSVKYDKENKGLSPGSLIVEGPQGFRVISPMDLYDIDYSSGATNVTGIAVERRITGALLYTASGVTPQIYEILGHNEVPLENLGMAQMIERENYVLKQLNLVQSSVPGDASAIILNGPRSDLLPGEVEKLLGYLEKGGRLLALVDFRIRELPNLNEFFSSYGIRFDYGVVIEQDQNYVIGTPFNVIPRFQENDITKPLIENRSPVILPYAMGISALDTRRRTVKLEPFLFSSNASFLKRELNNNSTDQTFADGPGPVNMGVTVLDPEYAQNEPQARIVAISCGSLLEPVNAFQQIPGNIDLFMNSLTWLEDKPENLSVRSRSLFLLPMRMSGLHILVFGSVFMVLIPLGFFVSGFVVWMKRRHL